ncbi:unnamed protein product [Mesocestoides corti]|uniref:Uncharacterized protein n=1 Tax=Mesocestoides corti TaxID=53468 RepID=A0A0R3UJN1_MESCO|nr:unnamed protein product [Mesocestoides corti]
MILQHSVLVLTGQRLAAGESDGVAGPARDDTQSIAQQRPLIKPSAWGTKPRNVHVTSRPEPNHPDHSAAAAVQTKSSPRRKPRFNPPPMFDDLFYY